MDCRDAADLMAPWADGQLSPAQEEIFERHIHRCGACQRLAERIAAQDLRPPPSPPARPETWARLDRALAAEMERGPASEPKLHLLKRRFSVSLPALVLYAALLVVLAGWGALTQRRLQASEAQTTALKLQIEREKRLAVQPASPPPPEYRLARSAPTRGMF